MFLTYIRNFEIVLLIQPGIISGIKNSSVVLCCITKKYTESKTCVREITFADEISKPIEILMFEKLKVGEIGSVGFIIAPIVRHNLYKIPQIFNEWKGDEFDAILRSVEKRLCPSSGSAAIGQSSSVASYDSINKPVTPKWKKSEESEVEMNFPISVNELTRSPNTTHEGTECKYARVKNYIRKKVIFKFKSLKSK